MLQVENLKLTPDEEESLLRARAAAALRVPEREVQRLEVFRRAVDARDGVRFVYTVRLSVPNEERVLSRCKNKKVSPVRDTPYQLPAPVTPPDMPPVIVGAGPAGLFCALAQIGRASCRERVFSTV